MSGSLNDIISALTTQFARPRLVSSDIQSLQEGLAGFVARQSRPDDSAFSKLQDELKKLHKSLLARSPEKLGPFMTVLKTVRPLITGLDDVSAWVDAVVVSFVDRTDQTRKSTQDAQDFVVEAMLHESDRPGAKERASERRASQLRKLIQSHIRRTDTILSGDSAISYSAANQGLQGLQGILLAFGRKRPLELFSQLDKFILKPSTRLQTLQILCAWLQQQQAHFDVVIKTSLVNHLVQCLLNDRATVVVNLALQAIVMLIPHIPAHLATYLPSVFLVYSRCLYWELFDASAKDKVPTGSNSSTSESQEETSLLFTTSPDWQVLHTVPLQQDSPAPELLPLFTYLYGLYPLNFLRFIRDPRKYLQDRDFPGADRYHLDAERLRHRSEQFQRVHLLHPEFFSTTVEEETEQNRWTTSEPPEVIAECIGLYVGDAPIPGTSRSSSGALPTLNGLLPALHGLQDLQQVHDDTPPTAILAPSHTTPFSTTPSTSSPRSFASGGGLTLNVDDVSPLASTPTTATTAPTTATTASTAQDRFFTPTSATASRFYGGNDMVTLQQELHLMRSAYQFERYLKHQHVVTIGQLKRDRIRQVIQEAESDRLNASARTLRRQLDAAMKFNETLQKEAQTRKTHVSRSEEQLTAKIRTLRDNVRIGQTLETRLDQAMHDIEKLRQLLVDSEGREIRLRSDLEDMQSDDKTMSSIRVPQTPSNGHEAGGMPIGSFAVGSLHAVGSMQDVLATSMPGTNGFANLTVSDDEWGKFRREFQALQAKLLDFEERLALSQKAQMESAQDTAALQQRLLESHEKKLSVEKAHTRVTEELRDLQSKYDSLAGFTGVASPDGAAESERSQDEMWKTSRAGYDDTTYAVSRSYEHGQTKAFSSLSPNGHSLPIERTGQIGSSAQSLSLSRSEGMAPSTSSAIQAFLPVLGDDRRGGAWKASI